MTLATGTRLGRYEIRSQLGVGGMGEVYLAQDAKLDREVALQILPDGLPRSPISNPTTSVTYSRDGRQLALARGDTTRDAVLITDEK